MLGCAEGLLSLLLLESRWGDPRVPAQHVSFTDPFRARSVDPRAESPEVVVQLHPLGAAFEQGLLRTATRAPRQRLICHQGMFSFPFDFAVASGPGAWPAFSVLCLARLACSLSCMRGRYLRNWRAAEDRRKNRWRLLCMRCIRTTAQKR